MYIRSFTKSIDNAMQSVRNRIGDTMLCRFLAILITVGFLIGSLLISAILIALITAFVVMGGGGSKSVWIMGVCLVYLLVVVITWSSVYIADGGALFIADSYANGKKLEGTVALGKSFRKLPAYMGCVCLQVLTLIPIIVLGVVVMNILSKSIDLIFENVLHLENWLDGVAGGLFWFSLVILAIAAIIWFLVIFYQTLFIFCVPAIVLDDMGPVKAFKKSLMLIKGEFKEMMKKVFLYNCGLAGIGLSFTMLIGTIMGIIALLGSLFKSNVTGSFVILSLCEWPARIVYSLVAGAFGPVITGMLYNRQKCKKEGTDLRIRLQQLKEARQYEANKEIMQ